MRKTTSLIAVPLVSASLVLTGCGGGSNTNTTTRPAATASQSVADADPAASCPTDNTQSFAKTRFVANVALAAGASYQWLVKPYQAGKFQKGADGRTLALVKAGLAGAFAAKQIKDATNNVKADPTLCKVFITPMTKLSQQLDGIGDKIRGGDLAAVGALGGSLTQIQDLAKSKGMEINPQVPDASQLGG